MPSTRSSSMPNVFDSSTVMTPSLPTLSMASAISSPISSSAAEMPATWAMSSFDSTSRDWFFSASTAASTPASIPRFRPIGLAPAATLRRPCLTMAWASTVAVVVPSPADVVGLLRDFLHELGPDLLLRVLQLDLLRDGHPVVGDGRGAPLLLQDDVATLGPEGDARRRSPACPSPAPGLAARPRRR